MRLDPWLNLEGRSAMKTMCKLFGLVLGMAVTLFVVPDVSSAQKDVVTISFSDWHLAEKRWGASLLESIAEFEKIHPNIKIKPEPVSLKERNVKYVTAIEGGIGPDVFHMDDNAMAMFIEKGFVKDVTAYVKKEGQAFKDAFYEPAWNIVSKDGSIWGLPTNMSSMVLIYNKKMFEAAGLDPNAPPKDWESFREYSKKLTRDTDGDGKTDQWGAGFVFGPASFHLRFSALLFSLGGKYLSDDNKQSLLNSPQVMDALTYLVNLKEDGIFPPGIVNAGAHDVRILMANKKIAMMVGSAWTPSIVDSIDKNFDTFNTIEMAALPGPSTCAFFCAWFINKNSKHPDEAWEFVKFLSSKKRLEKDWDDNTMLAARKDVNEKYPAILKDKFAKVMVAQFPNSVPIPQIKEWPEIENIVRSAVQSALTKERTVKDALSDAHAQVQEVLNKKK